MLELFGGRGTHGDAHAHSSHTERVFVFKSGRKRNRRHEVTPVGWEPLPQQWPRQTAVMVSVCFCFNSCMAVRKPFP